MILNENGIPVATYLPADPLIYSGGPNEYSVTSNFFVNGNPSTEESCTQDFTQEVIPSTRVIDDRIDAVIFPATTVIRSFPNLVQTATDVFVQSGFPPSEPVVARYINIYQSEIDSFPSSGYPPGSAIIERQDLGGIGGG